MGGKGARGWVTYVSDMGQEEKHTPPQVRRLPRVAQGTVSLSRSGGKSSVKNSGPAPQLRTRAELYMSFLREGD